MRQSGAKAPFPLEPSVEKNGTSLYGRTRRFERYRIEDPHVSAGQKTRTQSGKIGIWERDRSRGGNARKLSYQVIVTAHLRVSPVLCSTFHDLGDLRIQIRGKQLRNGFGRKIVVCWTVFYADTVTGRQGRLALYFESFGYLVIQAGEQSGPHSAEVFFTEQNCD